MTTSVSASTARSRRTNPIHWVLLISAAAYLLWSGIAPNGRFNWFMETAPAMAGALLLIATYRRFRFSTVSYSVAWVLAMILMTGGHYTYAEVPLGNWVRDVFGLSRNHFDRFGHFFQGVVPAIFARELLLRTSPLRPGKWLFVICISMALAISASYELFEWRYAVTFGGQRAEDFLGSQGDIWDAQQDMMMALLGAITSLIVLGALQTQQIRALTERAPSPHA